MSSTVVVSEQRILAGTAATLSWQYLDADGEPADPGTTTIGVTKADGTSVVSPGTPTVEDGTARTKSLTAAQTASLDVLVATWTAGGVDYTTTAEIVGGYYFTITDLRAREAMALGDGQKYPTADLQALRREVEDEFEEIAGVSFVPRYTRRRLDGTGTPCLLLPTPFPRSVTAVSELASDGTATAWSAQEVAAIRTVDVVGEVYSPLRSFPCGTQNLIVGWEHGYDRAPADVRQAAMLRIRQRATRPTSAVPDRAQTFQIDGGSVYRLDQAGARKTGTPDIDGVLDRYSMAIPGVA